MTAYDSKILYCYPCTGLDGPFGIQKTEATRISIQSAAFSASPPPPVPISVKG
jgi:hypothetical protein